MLNSLELWNVGPSHHVAMDPIAPRINLITGDNGLGKTFLLDAAWWAITDSWAGPAFEPFGDRAQDAAIRFTTSYKDTGPTLTQSGFDRPTMTWTRPRASQPFKGLAIFARADGSFAMWDYLRSPWRKLGSMTIQQKMKEAELRGLGDVGAMKDLLDPFLAAFGEEYGPANRRATMIMTANEVLKGLEGFAGTETTEKVKCAGLIDDWILWQARKNRPWKRLVKAIEALSPSPAQKLRPGPPVYLHSYGAKEVPTLQAESGQPVPLLLTSSALRRIISFAYLVVWALEEHERNAAKFGLEPTRDFLVVFDELEAHLHPSWQRTILNSVTSLIKALAGSQSRVQLIATTHSPLVLASAEPIFDASKDALWKLDLEDGQVKLERDEWHLRGDASDWLTSDVFDLGSSGSLEAEAARNEAARIMSSEPVDPEAAMRIHKELIKFLPAADPFWARWRYIGERKGWLAKPKGAA